MYMGPPPADPRSPTVIVDIWAASLFGVERKAMVARKLRKRQKVILTLLIFGPPFLSSAELAYAIVWPVFHHPIHYCRRHASLLGKIGPQRPGGIDYYFRSPIGILLPLLSSHGGVQSDPGNSF